MFAQTPFDKILGTSNIDMLKYEWVWFKNRPTGHFKFKIHSSKSHENILVFYKKALLLLLKTLKIVLLNPQGLVNCLKVNKEQRVMGTMMRNKQQNRM